VDLVVRRWTKYGHDRLYVSTPEGTKVGWLDVKTGQVTIESPEHEEDCRKALESQSAVKPRLLDPQPTDEAEGPEIDREALAPGEVTVPEAAALAGHSVEAAEEGVNADPVSPPPASPNDTAWDDLSLNSPGQAVRSLAVDELAASRERSKVRTFLARALDVHTDERAWRKGAEGEESVGARLNRLLEHGWCVLHSIPVGARGSDIDHVLIGPGGVFTINTKNHPGKSIWVSPVQIRVDGHPVQYLRNSRHEAERAQRLLTVAMGTEIPVQGALILLTGSLVPRVTIKGGGPEDVLILDRMDIPRVFKKKPPILTEDVVAKVYDVARRSTTWTTK